MADLFDIVVARKLSGGGGGGSSDLFSQVANIVTSASASEKTGTFNDGAAEISIAPFTITSGLFLIDSITIEVNGETKTLNSFPLDGSAEGAMFDDGATVVTPSCVFVGDDSYIGFYVYDNTYSRSDSIAIEYSAFNVYTPTDAIKVIYPSLSGGGE